MFGILLIISGPHKGMFVEFCTFNSLTIVTCLLNAIQNIILALHQLS